MKIKETLNNWLNNLNISSKNNNYDIINNPNSTGNTFQNVENLKAADVNTFIKTGLNWDELTKDSTNDPIESETLDFLNSRSINDWYLLSLQTNYYANTINFNCSNPYYFLEIKKVIRAAFIYGCAGLYYDNFYEKWYPVLINFDGINYRLYKIRDFNSQVDFDKITYDYLNIDITNLVIFHWGVDNQSALIYHYPFVRLQNQVLKQIAISSLALSKKLLYISSAPNPSLKEVKNWLNPFKFILNVFKSKANEGKFEWVQNEGHTNIINEIDYYNKLIAVWYDLYGRRVNTDIKKERNVSDEIEATQEHFNVLQNNYIDCFKAFIKELQLHKHSDKFGDLKYEN